MWQQLFILIQGQVILNGERSTEKWLNLQYYRLWHFKFALVIIYLFSFLLQSIVQTSVLLSLNMLPLDTFYPCICNNFVFLAVVCFFMFTLFYVLKIVWESFKILLKVNDFADISMMLWTEGF